MKSILDKSFVWVDSAHTDIRKTFARAIAEQKAKATGEAVKVQKVTPIRGKK